ncbi:MAG: DUF6340 family protein [Mediterranea sp.]|jgi:hypothetical protein|nr:DUF6340 family protein [Mediterranea sp.]
MKKYSLIYMASLGIAFCACQTYTVVPIDCLVPADVNFPAQIKRVGIVNNAGKIPGYKKTTEFIEEYSVNGDPAVTAETLAKAIAAENYFDQVIICDSALQTSDTLKPNPFLEKETVNALTERLNVDLLISLEEISIRIERRILHLKNTGFAGVDARVYPKVCVYIAGRNSPLLIINGSDSLFWENIESGTFAGLRKALSNEQLIAEASEFAGTVPVKHIIPHWETENRIFYPDGAPEMRDAAYFVRQNQWDRAFECWIKYAPTAKGIKKARAASNISLYYEMKDELEKAHQWGETALELARTAARKTTEEHRTTDAASMEDMPDDYTRIRYNQNMLEERRSRFVTLKIQMNRFNDDL